MSCTRAGAGAADEDGAGPPPVDGGAGTDARVGCKWWPRFVLLLLLLMVAKVPS